MTQTRSAWLGLAAGSIPILWSWRKKYLMALPIVAVVVVLLSPQPVKQRVFSYMDLTDVTLNERIYAWHGGWNIFREYPLTGVGPENLGQVYAKHRHPNDPRLRFTHLHSNFLQVAAELGAPGLLAWLSTACSSASSRSWRRPCFRPGSARPSTWSAVSSGTASPMPLRA